MKKTEKTPLAMAEVYRPDVLSFLSVSESELSAQPARTSRFCAKTQPSQRQKHKQRPHPTAVVPSFWKEGSGVVETKKVRPILNIGYDCFLRYHPVLRTPLLPGGGDPAGCIGKIFLGIILSPLHYESGRADQFFNYDNFFPIK